MQNSVLFPASDWRLRRKSAFVLANTLRRNSRVSVTSYDQPGFTHLLGHEYAGINLFPFKNGLRATSSNDSFWSANRNTSCFNKITTFIQTFYEKSRLHYLLPIIILVVYSFLGGFIFYTIESPEEQKILLRKKEYVEREEGVILQQVLAIEERYRALHAFYNATELRNQEVRKYRTFAMNRLNKAVYWYVLQVYYLNDQEMKKSLVLHPSNPEPIWKTYFGSSFGRIIALKNYTQQLCERCWEIGIEMNSPAVARVKLKRSIDEFNTFTGLQHVLAPTWTFWNSMFLAVTTYSTIGYGNITPKSRLGKLAAMVYALIGIPLVLMILHKLGRFFLLCLERFWDGLVWFMEFVSCVKNAEKLKAKVSAEERESGGMPVLLAIGVAFSWMFLCAAIFLKFEKDWDYFKSFYFFFCSLTTIGYGDVTPTNSEDMFIIFGFIIVGLSLVSMCINVIQLKLEELFEDLLLAMIEEYDAQPEGLPAPQVTPKMGVVDLWKMWKKRQRRARQPKQRRPTIATPEVFMTSTEKLPTTAADSIATPTLLRNSLLGSGGAAAPAAAANGATMRRRTTAPVKFSDLNPWKIFPFAKRRRDILLHEIHSRLNQHSKATQTEFYYFEMHQLRYAPEFAEELEPTTPSPPPTVVNVRRRHRQASPAASVSLSSPEAERRDAERRRRRRSSTRAVAELFPPSSSSAASSSASSAASAAANGGSGSSSSSAGGCSSSASMYNKTLRLTVSSSSERSSSPVFGGSSSSSSYVRRYLPTRGERRQTQCSSISAPCSVQSAPNPTSAVMGNSYGVRTTAPDASSSVAASGSVVVGTPQHRRWTFFEVGKTPRGAPRGLAVPYMYTRRNAKIHETTEMRRLIAEIDSRLVDCRSLAASCSSRATSRASINNSGGAAVNTNNTTTSVPPKDPQQQEQL